MKKNGDNESLKKEIGIAVCQTLSNVCDQEIPYSPDSLSLTLELNLGLTESARQSLSVPFTKISKKQGGSMISPSACAKLETVGEAVDLVFKHVKKQAVAAAKPRKRAKTAPGRRKPRKKSATTPKKRNKK